MTYRRIESEPPELARLLGHYFNKHPSTNFAEKKPRIKPVLYSAKLS